MDISASVMCSEDQLSTILAEHERRLDELDRAQRNLSRVYAITKLTLIYGDDPFLSNSALGALTDSEPLDNSCSGVRSFGFYMSCGLLCCSRFRFESYVLINRQGGPR